MTLIDHANMYNCVDMENAATAVFQLENEKGRAPGRALCTKRIREGTF